MSFIHIDFVISNGAIDEESTIQVKIVMVHCFCSTSPLLLNVVFLQAKRLALIVQGEIADTFSSESCDG